jgi:AraC family transcriptional regulator
VLKQSSDGLGWKRVFASQQVAQPFHERVRPVNDPLVIVGVSRSGPVRIRRRLRGREDEVAMPPGSIFILPSGQEFDVEIFQSVETILFYIRNELLIQAATELYGDASRLELLPRMGVCDSYLEGHTRQLQKMMEERQGDFFAEATGRLIAARLVEYHSNKSLEIEAGQPSGLSRLQLRSVKEHIESFMHDRLSLRQMADVINLSPIHFARMFKRSTGLPPHQYLTRARVSRAMELLEGASTLAEIAYRCGFAHPEHFTYVFRRVAGCTPGEHRRRFSTKIEAFPVLHRTGREVKTAHKVTG